MAYLFRRDVLRNNDYYAYMFTEFGIHSVQNLLSSSLLAKNLKIEIYKNIILPVVLVADIEGGT